MPIEKVTKERKPVLQYDQDNIFIKKYASGTEAARCLNTSQSNISKVCNGKRQTVKGFIFKFDSKQNII